VTPRIARGADFCPKTLSIAETAGKTIGHAAISPFSRARRRNIARDS
jgi:hypothetical protein